jgi:uroporphyrinogen decarboxylase
MTSREIIKKVINFEGPERIGLTFDNERACDIVSAGTRDQNVGAAHIIREEGQMEIYLDEWGNEWHRIKGMSKGGEVRTPVLADWKDLDTITLPDYTDPARYEGAKKQFAEFDDRYRIGGLPGFPFAIMRYMRSIEQFLEDVILSRDEVDELQRRVVATIQDAIRGCAEAGADGVFYCEDWGTQQRLLVSPTMWRDIFKPGYDAIIREADRCGVDVWMHSCGYITDIIPDLIEVGIKVLQFDQPTLHGIDKLGKEFGGRMTFWTPVDIQRTLQTGDRDQIRAEAKALCEKLGGHNGGFIAKNYGDLEGIGVDRQWDNWAYEAFVEYGKY